MEQSSKHQKNKYKNQRRIPSYIFKRNDFYYFRVALPTPFKVRLGGEVCLSLRTTLRSDALTLSRHLHTFLQSLLEDSEMDFKKLRNTLNEKLKEILEAKFYDIESSPISAERQGIIRNPAKTKAEECDYIAQLWLDDMANPDALLKESDGALNFLV
jgi:hypothetical protein